MKLKELIADFVVKSLSSKEPSFGISRADFVEMLEVPPYPELGDFAFPCFRLSKALRKAPSLIAKEISDFLQSSQSGVISSVKATGPYVNFFVDYVQVAKALIPSVFDKSLFDARKNCGAGASSLPKTMIEFSQPNTHKAFHVGHCRNVALGDSLVRMNRYIGYEVISANYIGDDGAHIAKCLWYYKTFNKEKPPRENKGEWLGNFYTAATQLVEDSAPELKTKYLSEISKVQQLMEARDPEMHALWLETKEWSMQSFREIYDWLDVRFDHFFYESEVLDESRKIVADGLSQNLFIKSQGAIGIQLEDDGLGFFMLLKSDGTTLYSTRDLALARRKFEDFGVARSIYVVASEQELHFRQVFKTLEKMGFEQVKNCFHLSYGLVVLPEGKMSSRQGNVIYFSQLRDLLVTHVLNNVFQQIDTSDWSQDEKLSTATKVAIAAIKYGMIASDPKKQIVFDLNHWTSFTGDTGPYLLYTYVRIQSILRKAGFQKSNTANLKVTEIFSRADEKAMLKRILNFNSAVERGVRENSPAVVACFLFELCQEFNSFYAKTPILKQEDLAQRETYLEFLFAFSQVLTQGCNLLGISVPERM